ncbi:DUF3408 domain-containing protein [Dysgonomonas sp. GY75]|uniref:DUF3408 domain-containing protein n=1 Tax=Dysgonomonas sp. GY75 TaxID=2780419 RepID=UPI0018838FA2|nr:DUF3408 domain-containing protein [Dysgonomonas sp. GY75]MBF0651554.1 DUF3408 domain-containing protein [Dysgonomonas sp. GY75]
MAKRKEVDVDEELIKSMMTGDIPRLNNEPVNEKPVPEKETEKDIPDENTEGEPEKETVQSKARRRREPKDYMSLFLKKNAGTKRQTYVNADLYDKISKILSIIAKDISVPNFIDNVLENHLKEYRDEINDMYRNNTGLLL